MRVFTAESLIREYCLLSLPFSLISDSVLLEMGLFSDQVVLLTRAVYYFLVNYKVSLKKRGNSKSFKIRTAYPQRRRTINVYLGHCVGGFRRTGDESIHFLHKLALSPLLQRRLPAKNTIH